MMASNILDTVVVPQTKPSHTASLIFLHGSGGSGQERREGIRLVFGEHLDFPHIRVLFPTAPAIPYTLVGGALTNVWYDRKKMAQDVPEDFTSTETTAEKINKLIDNEIKQGISVDRILLGGFSMGGGMAIQMGYRFRPDLGGIIAISSFLTSDSKVYEALRQDSERRRPPLLMCHGDVDGMVPYEWGDNTFKQLQKLGVPGTFHPYSDLDHTMSAEQILLMKNWVLQKLPEK